MKRLGKQWFFIVTALILALTTVSIFGVKNYYGDKEIVYFKSAGDIRWDIDIQGGVEAAFAPDLKDDSEVTAAQLESAKTILETRLVSQGINDYTTYIDNNSKQVIVRFPWQSGETDFDAENLRPLYENVTLFGVNLYEAGIADKVTAYLRKLVAGPGAVRKTLHETVNK